ncbi:MAG: MBL fold metallo-hydrolase [Odoribacter splanchnicus]
MEIKIFVNNPWQENTVVLYDRTEAVIIDCGCLAVRKNEDCRIFCRKRS